MSGYFLLLSRFVKISDDNANSVDLDQMPHSGAYDLGLYCQCPFYGTPGLNGLKVAH